MSESFGLLDILRIVSGVLILNSIASYWWTGSSTWGYDGKYIDPRFYKFSLTSNFVDLSLQQLSSYDGTNGPIYIGINGSVYDVTRAPHIYGPKGPYRFFSGKDSARAFVTGCFNKPDEFTYDLRGLDPQEVERDLNRWKSFFEKKYWYVGTVSHEPLEGNPPSPCEHVKFPV